MNWFKAPRLQLYSFLFSMPVIDLAINQIMYKDRLWHDWRIWLFSFPLIFLIGMASWYSQISYDKCVEKRYPGLHQSAARILRKSLVILIIMPPSVLLIFFIYDFFGIMG